MGNTILQKIGSYKQKIALVVFCIVEVAMILISMFVLSIPAVPACTILLIEVLLAIELHGTELWIHGAALLIELIAGFICKKQAFILVGMVVYIATICFMQFYLPKEK